MSTSAADAAPAVVARIGSGTISDRLGSRLVPLRTIGVALALFTACAAAAVDAPLGLLIPLFIVAGVLPLIGAMATLTMTRRPIQPRVVPVAAPTLA